MRPRTIVLVPLRALGVGKSRLAHRLTPEQRASLARAMFRDVVAAVSAAAVDEVVVAAGDAGAAGLARELGLRSHVDAPGTCSLNDAVAGAAGAIPGPADLLVVAGDLPCLAATEVDELLAADAPVVVAPTHDGGTAALLRRPADAISTAYGPNSACRHRAQADSAGLAHRIVDAPGLHRDVDTWADLVALRGQDVGAHTAAVLPELLTPAAPV